MGALLSPGPRLAGLTAALASAGVLALAGAASLIPGLLTDPNCAGDTGEASSNAASTIPARYLALYQQAGAAYRVPWAVLAAIGAIESDHGRSTAPGVQTGVNAFGCCAGPMQFNVTNGPPSTWQTYRVDGNHDGDTDPYDPADAIASAGRYLHALLEHASGDISARSTATTTQAPTSPTSSRDPVAVAAATTSSSLDAAVTYPWSSAGSWVWATSASAMWLAARSMAAGSGQVVAEL